MATDQEPNERSPEPRSELQSACVENPPLERLANSWEGYCPEMLTILLEG